MGEQFSLDWDFVDHLGVNDSLLTIQQEQIAPELIEIPKAREIYEFQLKHLKEHKAWAAADIVEDEFKEVDLHFTDPVANIEDLIERLRSRYVRNQGARALKRLAKTAVSDPLRVAHEMNEEARKLSDIVSKRGRSIGSGEHNISEQAYHRRVAMGVQGSLGYDELDTHFYGLNGLNFIIAPPKGLKSWQMVRVLINNLVDHGKFCVLDSLELPEVDTDWRIKCMAANIPYWKYHRGQFTDAELKKVRETSDMLDSIGAYRVRKLPPKERTVDYLVNSARDLGADVVLIDQLQYVVNERGKSLGEMNDTGEYWAAINRLVDLSDDGPILVAHQFNRSVQGADAMPDFQQVKGSSAIEEGATLALGMWSNKEMRASNIFEVGTLVSRHYGHKAWQIQVKLSKECNFKILGES